MYFYLKALHIIFIVTWFSGLFYIVRLFIYNSEANHKPEAERKILQAQFEIMIKRLWLGITWPSAVLTFILGPWVLYLFGSVEPWMWIKLAFVAGLYAYHFSLQKIYSDQRKKNFHYSPEQLRIWNEVATLFLVAIVMLAVVKNGLSAMWGILGLVALALALMIAIRIYKNARSKK